jgi:hypothetical protein
MAIHLPGDREALLEEMKARETWELRAACILFCEPLATGDAFERPEQLAALVERMLDDAIASIRTEALEAQSSISQEERDVYPQKPVPAHQFRPIHETIYKVVWHVKPRDFIRWAASKQYPIPDDLRDFLPIGRSSVTHAAHECADATFPEPQKEPGEAVPAGTDSSPARSRRAERVLDYLKRTDKTWCIYDDITEGAQCGRNTVSKALRELEEVGEIERRSRKLGGGVRYIHRTD